MDRSRITRWAAPVAFLAAITIGALVIRAGFEDGRQHSSKQPTTATATTTSFKTTTTTKKKHSHPSAASEKHYTIQSGDTLGSIAIKTGTTVAELEQLNPGIDPTALHAGQTIRVQ